MSYYHNVFLCGRLFSSPWQGVLASINGRTKLEAFNFSYFGIGMNYLDEIFRMSLMTFNPDVDETDWYYSVCRVEQFDSLTLNPGGNKV